jgi:hypothetical protein
MLPLRGLGVKFEKSDLPALTPSDLTVGRHLYWEVKTDQKKVGYKFRIPELALGAC